MKITKKYLRKIIKEECAKLLVEEPEEGDPAGMADLDRGGQEEERKGLHQMSQGKDASGAILNKLKEAHKKYQFIMHNRDRVDPGIRVNAEAISLLIQAVELLNDPSTLKT